MCPVPMAFLRPAVPPKLPKVYLGNLPFLRFFFETEQSGRGLGTKEKEMQHLWVYLPKEAQQPGVGQAKARSRERHRAAGLEPSSSFRSCIGGELDQQQAGWQRSSLNC